MIGRITLTGAITEYPIPTYNSNPMVMEPVPDGALWFTEFFGYKIGRMTVPTQ
jgi:virginiamycin B lyase